MSRDKTIVFYRVFLLACTFVSLSLTLSHSLFLSLSLSLEWMCRRFLKKGRAVNFDDEIACSKTTASHPTSPTPPFPNPQIIKSFLWPNRIPPSQSFSALFERSMKRRRRRRRRRRKKRKRRKIGGGKIFSLLLSLFLSFLFPFSSRQDASP